MMRLGPQGLQVLQQLQQQNHNDGHLQPPSRIPQQLDFVLDELLNPPLDKTPSQLLSYMAYYYPKIKNEANITLLTSTFLRCPLFFNDNQIITLEENYKIVEFFNYIVLHKYNISVPHLPFDKFYRGLVNGLKLHIAQDPAHYHWKVVPVLSGILSTSSQRVRSSFDSELQDLLKKLLLITLDHDRSCMQNFELLSTTLVCASFTDVSHLPRLRNNYNLFLTDLIYSKKLNNCKELGLNFDWKSDPVTKNLNKLAKLINHFNSVLGNRNVMNLNILLDTIMFSMENLYKTQNELEDMELLKYIVFTNITIFENLANNTILGNSICSFQISLARKSLTMLFYTNYIIDKIGTGGFNSYNYIYYMALDTLADHDTGTLEDSILTSMATLDFQHLRFNVKQASGLKFLLTVIENVIDKVSPKLQQYLFPFIGILVGLEGQGFFQPNDEYFKPVLESAHSVMLKFLKLKFLSSQEAKHYVDILFDQFPEFLSLQQIIVCLLNVITNNLIHYDLLFSELVTRVIHTVPKATILDNDLKTLRASLIFILIQLLEFCPVEKFHDNLQLCLNLIYQIDNDLDHKLLLDALFEMITLQNRISPQKGNIGVEFWYHTVTGNHL